MVDDEVGYQKPPKSKWFKPGVSGNPDGRRSRKPLPLAEKINAILDALVEYRERGRLRVATRRELGLKIIAERAAGGDLSAAEHLLKIRQRAERYGDTGVDPVIIRNWLPDYPGQTAETKTKNATAEPVDAEARREPTSSDVP